MYNVMHDIADSSVPLVSRKNQPSCNNKFSSKMNFAGSALPCVHLPGKELNIRREGRERKYKSPNNSH